MGMIAAAVEHLLAAGVTGAALVQAIADMEAAALDGVSGKKGDAAEKRRAYDRERKRKAKAARENSTGNSTGNDAENAEFPQSKRNYGGTQEPGPALPLPPNENNSNPPTPTHPDNTPARDALAHEGPAKPAQASKPKARKKKGEFEAIDRPDDVSEQVWEDFLKLRAKHDADVTDTALKGFRREADRVGWSLERAIEESITRGWRGFKAEWVKNDERGSRTGSGGRFQPDGALAFMQQTLGLD